MNLFILGTGFDAAHHVPGMYCDFRQYVREKTSDVFLNIPCNASYADGFQLYDVEDSFNAMKYVISESGNDDTWGRFEETLGKLDFQEFLLSRNSGRDIEYISARNKEALQTFLNVADVLKDYFQEWVKQIPVSIKKKVSFEKLLSQNDVFLVFNYTDTLEQTYGIQNNIFHIHGTKDGNIILGHGDSNYDFAELERIYPGIEGTMPEIKATLRKRVEKVLQGNTMRSFLQCLSTQSISKVYSYGFSYSDVDMPYIEEICKKTNSETEWLFNDYDDEAKRETFKNRLLKQCGYTGKVSSFHID